MTNEKYGRMGYSSCSGTLYQTVRLGGYLDIPLQPGDPTKCMHFAGSPIRAFLPRVRKSIVLASCGTDFTSLQKFLISH